MTLEKDSEEGELESHCNCFRTVSRLHFKTAWTAAVLPGKAKKQNKTKPQTPELF